MDNLQHVLGVNVPFADYATHDDRVESSERMDDAAIIKAVANDCETLAVDENEDPDASDSEEGVVECDDTREARKKKLSRHLLSFCTLLHSRRLIFSVINYQRAFQKNWQTLKMLLSHLKCNLATHKPNF